ncbi:DNA polymerase II large subunit [Methanobacterium sp. BAmetb5]|uniref:DNA polymerase II large subunit n=1 Tax=Methanobacterium sp. BAmetb5 TaxID=2025351 RepID=UPI000E81B690|nr:DNA polymerase II large subunit [Methanobacterium sp. BAmetb5]AXV40008.1 MAG: DNA polymerase II large subunit [Methanobacterium sp. BAmetb5]
MGYFETLEEGTTKAYKVAEEARKKGHDIELEPEIPLAKNLAERVEGLVGPPGVAEKIKNMEDTMSREEVAFHVAKEIVTSDEVMKADPGNKDQFKIKEEAADQAVRTALSIITEGVVAAPLEGIARVSIKRNFDQTWYLAVYFTGPIRSAGGTASALAVLVTDYIRYSMGLDAYKPTDGEIERYVEEAELYESEVTNLQYSPSPDEVRTAAKNIPVEVTGEPTDQVEVSHRDLERVETNHLRGGALLAMVEGVIQKAPKVLKYAKMLNMEGWDWLDEFSKTKKVEKTEEADEESKKEETKIDDKYMRDIIGGRPVLAYPQTRGGFRLRYGRSRNTGLAAMGVHPATMEIVEFLAVGTQMKIERPGKGNCVVPCDTIDGPLVKLRNGDVVNVDSVEEARKIRSQVVEIIYLGDMLVAFGEFLRNNHPLLPAGWCQEWWIQLLENSDSYDEGQRPELDRYLQEGISAPLAFELSKKYQIPLHPDYTYFYHDVTRKDLNALQSWLNQDIDDHNMEDSLIRDPGPEKRILESLGVPHRVQEGKVVLAPDEAYTLLNTLSRPLNTEDNISTMEAVNQVSPVEIMAKAPTYLGGRVGRPEKTKERMMKPAPHALFPIGTNGGSRRNIIDAAKKGNITVDIARCKCTNPECGVGSMQAICPVCGARTVPSSSGKKRINLANLLRKAYKNSGVRKLDEIKGVQGMISEEKFPEPLEKGILRAKNGVYTFKDATIRHDSTDLPLTHFIPREIGVSPQKLREIGYTHDIHGDELKNPDQVVELRIQDLVISEACAEYLVRVSHFIDDLLKNFYEMEPFYQVKTKEDLVGHLAVGLAPHTSAGVLGRIIGFTKAAACYAHPYFHSAKRRNCDSDEDSVMLLMDALLNFSKVYLPSSRGGRMDAPLVLSSRIDPEEIDDESHNLDTMETLPLELYQKTLENVKPADVVDLVDNVKKRLGKDEQYRGLIYSHETSSIHQGPKICLYKTLPTMKEKVDEQIKLAERIRAVDQKGVVEGVLNSHFLPDMAGNIRAFARQKVRCTKCNKKYRRIPLSGECSCGGNLILSISKGSVMKYLDISKELANRYPIDPYLVQRIELLESGIHSLFESDRSKQSSLDVFL